MGDTISTLVFRPPKPTPIDPNDYFYLDVDIRSPLCTTNTASGTATTETDRNKCHIIKNHQDTGNIIPRCHIMCLDTATNDEESDLASLDRSFLNIVSDNVHDYNTLCGIEDAMTEHGEKNVACKIPAFFVRRRGARYTILFSHGNAEDLGMMYKRMKDLALVLCVNVLAYDYTGYGLSTYTIESSGQDAIMEESLNEFMLERGDYKNNIKNGNNIDEINLNVPSENMAYRNIEAAYAYLRNERNIPAQNIILYGRSLGSGPSCYLAAKTAMMGDSVGGLILHSPFLSVYKVVADVWGMDLHGDLFNNEKRAPNIRCPTLIIHGKLDEVVPFWHAPRLLNAIPPEFRAPPFYVNHLGHNHIESRVRGQYIQTIAAFITKYLSGFHGSETIPKTTITTIKNENNGGESQLYGGKQGRDQKEQIRYTNTIPVHKRATTEEMKEHESHSFYINQTWIRHAKSMFVEVFSDNICNVSHSVRNGADSRSRNDKGVRSTVKENSKIKRQVLDKYVCGQSLDDARDDVDEFSPWTKVKYEGRQIQLGDNPRMSRHSSTDCRNRVDSTDCTMENFDSMNICLKRSQSASLNRQTIMNQMVQIHQPIKLRNNSSANPNNKINCNIIRGKGGSFGKKIWKNSAWRLKNGGGILGFRK